MSLVTSFIGTHKLLQLLWDTEQISGEGGGVKLEHGSFQKGNFCILNFFFPWGCLEMCRSIHAPSVTTSPLLTPSRAANLSLLTSQALSMLTRATQLVWWSWLTPSGLSVWAEWVHIYCEIPHKYIHGKQSVSGKDGVLLRNSSPVSLLWYRCVWGWKANHTPGYWALTSTSVSLSSCNCKAPKGMQEQPWRVTSAII